MWFASCNMWFALCDCYVKCSVYPVICTVQHFIALCAIVFFCACAFLFGNCPPSLPPLETQITLNSTFTVQLESKSKVQWQTYYNDSLNGMTDQVRWQWPITYPKHDNRPFSRTDKKYKRQIVQIASFLWNSNTYWRRLCQGDWGLVVLLCAKKVYLRPSIFPRSHATVSQWNSLESRQTKWTALN